MDYFLHKVSSHKSSPCIRNAKQYSNISISNKNALLVLTWGKTEIQHLQNKTVSE